MFFLGIFLNLFSSFIIASIFESGLIIFIAFFALIILNIEILSLFSLIEAKNVILLNILELIILLFFWKKKKFPILNFKNSINFKRLKNALLLDKSLIILSIAFLFLIIVTFFLAIIMPPLEPDSQTYHFLRAVEFVSQKNLSHFDTNDIRALIMPINSEIFYSWMLIFKKNFSGFGLLSFFSYILAILSNFSILSKFKISYRKRLWAIFLFSSLSAVIIQIPSMQTDILVGSLLICSIALFLRNNLYFSSLSLSLALGVKSTGFIALLSFLILILGISYFIKKEKNFKNLGIFIGFLIINFIIFSSYNYILNFIDFHSPFSNHAAYLGHKFWGGYQGFIANLIHFSFQSIDFTGFKWGYYLNDVILNFKNTIFQIININPKIGCNVEMEKVNIITDEQIIGFGILGFMVFLPCIFISILKIFFNKNKRTIFLFFCGLAFLINIVILSLSIAYMVFSIRFIVAFVCLSSVCLIYSYKKKSFLKPFIIFFMIFYMTLIPTHIRRMPFFRIIDILKENNFNQEKFIESCFRGKITNVLLLAPQIYDTVKSKYPNCRNIAIIKNNDSPLLYLKNPSNKEFRFDFLNAANIDKINLNKYDLIVVEGEIQIDNVFNREDIIIDYKIENGKVVFNNQDKINCCYSALNTNPTEIISRECLGYHRILKNQNFKEIYTEIFKSNISNIEIKIHYFKNIKFSDKI